MLDSYFQNCMYFASNLLNRAMTKIAEEEFGPTGLSPTYAYLLMVVNEQPGITQKDLGQALHVAPSTITRFIEKLANKGLVTSRTEGKSTRIDLTPAGTEKIAAIQQCLKNLYGRYSEILGKEEGKQMTSMLYEYGKKLEKHV